MPNSATNCDLLNHLGSARELTCELANCFVRCYFKLSQYCSATNSLCNPPTSYNMHRPMLRPSTPIPRKPDCSWGTEKLNSLAHCQYVCADVLQHVYRGKLGVKTYYLVRSRCKADCAGFYWSHGWAQRAARVNAVQFSPVKTNKTGRLVFVSAWMKMERQQLVCKYESESKRSG